MAGKLITDKRPKKKKPFVKREKLSVVWVEL